MNDESGNEGPIRDPEEQALMRKRQEVSTEEFAPAVIGSADDNGNIYPPQPSKGDFLGQDRIVLGKYNINISREGSSIQIGDRIYTSSFIVDKSADQIEHIRGRLNRLIPTKEALVILNKLRQPSPISDSLKGNATTSVKMSLPFGMGEIENTKDIDIVEDYMNSLEKIQSQLSPQIEAEKLPKLQSDLRLIAGKINIEIYRLQSVFLSFLYPATASQELTGNLVSKIGHKELREEAQMRFKVVSQLVLNLDIDRLIEIDILSDEAKIAIGVMYEIEQSRIVIERLVELDRRKRNRTIATVIVYLISIIILMATLFFSVGVRLQLGQQSLSELKLPLFGIPWPVTLWSFIGSIAAMVYRFNRRPIYDFGDAIKWMITRPFQGVVLGSTFYLVLVSGLFLLTGTNTTETTGSVRVDEIILVLSFLVGFSDRFADTVFNTLVEKYSQEPKKTEEAKGEDESAAKAS